ncbi:GPW/gp25 family protein [Hafnia alvei]|uniref:GPW/gp25 family protein n=1 Tax=Hafnia alvei TaxID=569 RepID=UPI000B6C8617|nr:GPW/gp25 family protein [Hafnia alvei]MBI0277271.1 GPW/gp25 family protein [Hafnia alvei]PNK97559.1 baseplate assembly protein [Hafnia alvei]PNL03592.1 baseplate assembly protein [Hafnia alvei]
MSDERYIGMNAINGYQITDDDHIRQSVTDILITPIGSRVMRRHYGSQVNEIIDQPQGDITSMRMMSAIYTALLLWEPRISITDIVIANTAPDRATAKISGYRADTDAPFSTAIPLRKS